MNRTSPSGFIECEWCVTCGACTIEEKLKIKGCQLNIDSFGHWIHKESSTSHAKSLSRCRLYKQRVAPAAFKAFQYVSLSIQLNFPFHFSRLPRWWNARRTGKHFVIKKCKQLESPSFRFESVQSVNSLPAVLRDNNGLGVSAPSHHLTYSWILSCRTFVDPNLEI